MSEHQIIFSKAPKEMIIFSGVLVACGCFLALAVRLICVNDLYALPFAVGLAVLPWAIYRGWKWGYVLARILCGLIAVIEATYPINPCAQEDIEFGNISYAHILWFSLSIAGFAVFLFYCLGEYGKARGVKIDSAAGRK